MAWYGDSRRHAQAAKGIKSKGRQIGTSNRSRDQHYSAKKAGKRKSKSGKTYYERRRNRSDKGYKL